MFIFRFIGPVTFLCIPAALCFLVHAYAYTDEFSTLVGKHVVGYQGWFACPSDSVDPRWSHWFQGGMKPEAKTVSVDLWPDLSEFGENELCQVSLVLRSGAPADVFSSENTDTIRRDFLWMRSHGIDGAAVQRVLSQITNQRFAGRANLSLHNIRVAAEAEGRGFFVMYDLFGLLSDQDVALVEADWRVSRIVTD